ncbi:class I SAM-dependent methyltransferase [filamentous cyanobacterium CCT1]|nr:class I SAM-dependent methyltransferase [filamentous cyanobacterium CCT1]PSN79484.1 class I SAM-dependent methyltransferase [filamentous cyanobacterium CCP4]
MMNRFQPFLARQLGNPSGWFGRLLLRLLNRGNANLNDLVLEALQIQSSDGQSAIADPHILEIGFGGGDLIAKLVASGQPSKVVGVERSPEALQLCQRRFRRQIAQGTVELHQANAEALPFPDDAFSHICTVNTLYFWPSAPQVLAECHRVLCPGGRLVVGYASKAYLERQGLTQHGFTAYETAEVEALLRAAGFTAVSTRDGGDRAEQTFCTDGVVPA